MEDFLQQIQLILPVPGVDVLRPAPTRQSRRDVESAPLLFRNEVGTNAKTIELDGQFIVLRVSTARRASTPSFDTYRVLREELILQGKLVERDEKLYEFATDVEFNSPSAAAAVVAAASSNGRKRWKLENGMTYADWKESQVEEASRGRD